MFRYGLYFTLACAALEFSTLQNVYAQDQFPSRIIRMLVPFPAGGTTDIVAREIAAGMGRSFGRQVVVDNRPGGSGAIAGSMVAQAQPDGYTLLVASTAILAIAPHLNRQLPYDPLKSFDAISQVASTVNILVAHPSLPVHSVKDLLSLAKARPGEVTFGSTGVGSVGHMGIIQFHMLGGVRTLHVPYKGAAPAETDVVAGHISVMAAGILSILPQIRAGKLRALAVTSTKRANILPDLPTVAETIPGYDVTAWFGVLAPTGTPQAILDRLNNEIIKALRDEGLRERFSKNGAEIIGNTRSVFAQHIKQEFDRYGKFIDAAGLKAD